MPGTHKPKWVALFEPKYPICCNLGGYAPIEGYLLAAGVYFLST